MVQAVMQVMESNGELQMKLHSLASCSPPAVRPTHPYQSKARG